MREQGLADKIRILPTVMEETPFYILFHRHSAPERLTLFVNTLQRLADLRDPLIFRDSNNSKCAGI